MASNQYRQAGVDQKAADQLAGWIAKATKNTGGSGVVEGIGGFAGLYELPGSSGRQLLVGCTDGVGTKLKIAFATGKHETVGIDLVAMSVNDLLTTGGRPLFFLDYLGIGKLAPRVAREVLKGVVAGCKEAGCALLGGETAQLPDFYSPGEYDLAGFAVGFVERKKLLGPSRVKEGDVLIGLASSGIHSNGYSLVRRIVKNKRKSLKERIPGLKGTLGDELLRPTRIYEREVRALLHHPDSGKAVHALAHITGGGIAGNLPRILPEKCGARIDKMSWPRPPIFELLRDWGKVSEKEMFEVFNMGLGMIAVVDKRAESRCRAVLGATGVYRIGEVVKGPRKVVWA